MNANEANAALKNLTYGKTGTPEHDHYNDEHERIEGEFKDYLEGNFADNLPASLHSALWSKAWSDGHDSGFGGIEASYAGAAEFAHDLINALNK